MVSLGFDRQCITPEVPFRLRGYEIKRIANEVHDDLYTRCLLLEENGVRYVLAQCDLVGLDYALVNEVWERIKDLGIDKEHIVITATHTHAGPGGVINTATGLFSQLQEIFGPYDEQLVNHIADAISVAVHHAANDLVETNVTIARGKIENVGKERHDASLPGDDSLLVYRFERKDGKQVLLYNYACHPTVTGPNNLQVTADFPYAVERDLDYDMVMFINSCCGDISTRFTRESSSFEQVEIYCKRIIQGIEEALAHPVYQGELKDVQMHQYTITLPIKKVRPVEEEQAQLEKYLKQLEEAKKQNLDAGQLRVIASYAEGASTAVNLAKALQGIESEDVKFTMMVLGGIKIAVAPGELFSTLGVPLKQEGIEVFGYGNGYYLYLADEHSYDKGFYEAMCSPFEKGVGELLIKEMKERGKTLCQ
ncbi:MAG: neutral/alkaline non-lysosomal ceramidase N-terminal domain-containing protein [Erysipelotrichaceae bacterium]|nr:neutral/alkaline non-lysosomal ceramidase N-terminal domain-containing protein [Erysipelotrichaceae bacterium]